MQIIAFAGARQSGKSSACNFLVGQTLKDFGRIEDFRMNPDGKIIANTAYDINGVQEKGEIVVNLDRKDEAFVNYAMSNIWPYVKTYAVADKLKEFVCSVFSVDMTLAYGTDEDKNTLTKVKWESMYKFLDKKVVKELKAKNGDVEYLTIRQLMQLFGSEVCRTLYEDCWIDSCLSQIQVEQPELALICDVRFPNEINKIKAIGGKIILLKKDDLNEDHMSEKLLREMDQSIFDGVIDNTGLTMEEKNEKIVEVLNGILQGK